MCCRNDRHFWRKPLMLPSKKILSEGVFTPYGAKCYKKDNPPEMAIPTF